MGEHIIILAHSVRGAFYVTTKVYNDRSSTDEQKKKSDTILLENT